MTHTDARRELHDEPAILPEVPHVRHRFMGPRPKIKPVWAEEGPYEAVRARLKAALGGLEEANVSFPKSMNWRRVKKFLHEKVEDFDYTNARRILLNIRRATAARHVSDEGQDSLLVELWMALAELRAFLDLIIDTDESVTMG